MKTTILGVKVDNLTKPELLQKIEEFLDSNKQNFIVTPNPEFLVAAQKDHEFKKILNQADLAIPDGIGLKIAAGILHRQKLHRHTGVDTFVKICEIASQTGKSVYLFGAAEGVARRTKDILKKQFPKLKIAGAESGGKISNFQFPISNSELNNDHNLAKIKASKPDILFVALGQIKQEKWLAQNLSKLPSVRLAMGVGGSFDYISRKTPRAPKFLRILGLEWLFRLILEPKRVGRVWNAVVMFSWLVIREKLKD